MTVSDDPVPGTPEDSDVQAGELALGVLTGEDRAAALRRVLAEPTFAAAVEAWQRRLAPMLDALPAVEPPPGTWNRIAAQIATASSKALARWRAAAVTATALAACLVAVIVLRPAPPAPPVPGPILLAQVHGSEGAALVTAQYDAASGRLRVRTADLPAGALVPELWVIGDDATPRSLGFVALNGGGDYAVTAADRARLADGATIAVTLEQRADRPHVAPSTPVLGTARLTMI